MSSLSLLLPAISPLTNVRFSFLLGNGTVKTTPLGEWVRAAYFSLSLVRENGRGSSRAGSGERENRFPSSSSSSSSSSSYCASLNGCVSFPPSSPPLYFPSQLFVRSSSLPKSKQASDSNSWLRYPSPFSLKSFNFHGINRFSHITSTLLAMTYQT